jgi:hypothetical protein
MRRPLLFSCALHGVIVLIVLSTAAPRDLRQPAGPIEIAMDGAPAPIAAVAVDVDTLEDGGGGGPARPREPAVVASARVHRRRPVAVHAAVADPAPVPQPAPIAAPAASEEGPVEGAQAAQIAAPTPTPAPPGEPGAQAVGAGVGAGAGNGLGDGLGDGFGAGVGRAAMSRALHARVLGDDVVDVRAPDGRPTISHDEATALRTRDSFPRLPESVWPQWRPYVVKLEICVAADGRVSDAALRSAASARLDPVVLAAAKTWQYRPRLVDGKPAPFCHGVVIKYESW